MLHDGDLVEFHVEVCLDDGTTIYSSRGRRARVAVLGRGQMLHAFEDSIRAMAEGESVDFRIDCQNAYGPRDPERVHRIQRANLPLRVRVGTALQLDGGSPAVVVALDDESALVDANHPLAGQALRFTVQITSVQCAAGA